MELEGGGFVVTSGDTELEPVLSYSKDGTWVDDVKRNPLLAMLPIDVAAATEAATSAALPTGSGKRLTAGGSSGALGTTRPTSASWCSPARGGWNPSRAATGLAAP